MIEIKIWPEGPCDECKRRTSESIKTSIQELHDGVYEQGYKEGLSSNDDYKLGFNSGLAHFRAMGQKLIEEKKRTINKSDLMDIECDLTLG